MKTLQSGKLNNTIKFGGLGIADLQDCLIWVDRYLPGYQYGLFMDPLLILDLVHGEDHVKGGSESGSILNKMNLQAKLNMRSGGETAALDAMRFARPRKFHLGRPTTLTRRVKSRLSELETHEV